MAEESKGSGLRFGALMTLLPVVTAAFGGLQYYRDQQQREFEAITFYLQNQATFDPCANAQLANLNLGMIENTYPNVYARIVQHVENRASQCDSVMVIAREQASASTSAPVLTEAPAAEDSETPAPEAPAPTSGAATRSLTYPQAPGAPVQQRPLERQMRANIPAAAQEAAAYFRNRYDRMASLPMSRARKIAPGHYRVLIQISDESDRALAQSVEAALREKGNTAPTIDLVPVRVEKPELRYYRKEQAADAERLATEIEQAMAANGAASEVTPSLVDRAGLPPGVMELWLP